MEEIAKALAEYQALVSSLQWLQQNNQLADGADIGELAFSGAIAYKTPAVIEAFVAVMEIAKKERERIAAQPKRMRSTASSKALAQYEARERQEREIYDRAKALSIDYAAME